MKIKHYLTLQHGSSYESTLATEEPLSVELSLIVEQIFGLFVLQAPKQIKTANSSCRLGGLRPESGIN